MRLGPRTVRLVLGAIGLVMGLVLASASPAAAHAALVSSDPAANERVAASPTEVRLTFSEPVTAAPEGFTLRDGHGTRLAIGPVAVDGRVVHVRLPALADGAHAFGWRVVSADTHAISGTLVFTVGAAATAAPDARAIGDAIGTATAVRVAGWVSRSLLFAGLLVLCGLVVLHVLADVPVVDWSRVVTACGAVALTSTVVGVAAQAADQRDGRTASAFAADAWRDVVDTRFGRLWLLRAVLVVVLMLVAGRDLGALRRSVLRRAGCVTSAAAIGATFIGAGHAAAGRATALAWVADATHLLAAAIWTGGLVVLVAVATQAPERLAPLAVRVSALALAGVVALVGSGLVQAWRQRALTADALTDTWYGQLLVVKVALVAVVLVLAASARRRVRAAGTSGAGALRTTVVAELVGIAAVVAVTGGLVHATPPTPSPTPSPAAPEVHVARESASGVTVELRVSPLVPGPVTVDASVVAGGPVEEITVVALPPTGNGDVAPLPLPVHPMAEAEVMASGVVLPYPGEWWIVVTVRTGAFDAAEVRFAVPLR